MIKTICTAALLLLLPTATHAASWQVCRYQAETVSQQKHTIEAVLKRADNPSPHCPPAGSRLSFTPETADYQSLLPRRL